MSFLITTETAFGLDISDRALRLIQLKRRGPKIYVQTHNEASLPNTYVNQDQATRYTTIADTLKKLVKTRHGRTISEEVIVALPEARTFVKVIDAPPAGTDIVSYFSDVLPQHVPLPLNEVYYDWQYTNATNTQILIGACAQSVVDNYVGILNSARLLPTAFEIEAAAIVRALIVEDDDTMQLIVDFGATRTSLIMYDKQMIRFTVSLPISGQAITQLITETLGLDYEQAEQAKIVCGLDTAACQGALRELFTPTITELIEHIKKTIVYYQTSTNDTQQPTKIIFTGGGANFKQLKDLTQGQLQIPIEISNPWQKVINPDTRYFTPERSQSYTTAIGLALRGLDAHTTL